MTTQCITRLNDMSNCACAAFLAAIFFTATALDAQTTVTFQQGVGGYSDTLDVFVGKSNGAQYSGGTTNVLGSASGSAFIDGFAEESAGVPGSGPAQIDMLIRFDNIFGSGVGQIPLGANIIDASLTLTTSANLTGSERSTSPYGVAQLLTPFDTSTTWNSLGDGINVTLGEAKRPIDNGFRGPLVTGSIARTMFYDVPVEANIQSIVQSWANGETNDGLLVRSGTNDGWSVYTSSAATLADRPQLSITYDTNTQPLTTTVTLQQGLNGYTGSEGIKINDTLGSNDPGTTDLSTSEAAFIFFRPGTLDDASMLIQFDDIFTSEGGTVPDAAQIVSAKLVLTNEEGALSTSSPTDSDFAVHEVLVDWDLSTPYSGGVFGFDGPDVSSGELGPVLDTTGAIIQQGQTSLDVTSAVLNWQSGATTNNGLNVRVAEPERAEGGSDAWLPNMIGAVDQSVRPALVIEYVNETAFAGDFNGDGTVDAADYTVWRDNLGSSEGNLLAGNGNGGVIDQTDYILWSTNFGSVAAGGVSAAVGVPEPTSAFIALVGSFLLLNGTFGSRKS